MAFSAGQQFDFFPYNDIHVDENYTNLLPQDVGQATVNPGDLFLNNQDVGAEAAQSDLDLTAFFENEGIQFAYDASSTMDAPGVGTNNFAEVANQISNMAESTQAVDQQQIVNQQQANEMPNEAMSFDWATSLGTSPTSSLLTLWPCPCYTSDDGNDALPLQACNKPFDGTTPEERCYHMLSHAAATSAAFNTNKCPVCVQGFPDSEFSLVLHIYEEHLFMPIAEANERASRAPTLDEILKSQGPAPELGQGMGVPQWPPQPQMPQDQPQQDQLQELLDMPLAPAQSLEPDQFAAHHVQLQGLGNKHLELHPQPRPQHHPQHYDAAISDLGLEPKANNQGSHENRNKGNFFCPYDNCDKRFTAAQGLKIHIGEHQGVVYSCDQCTESFKHPSNLKRHRRTAHGPASKWTCPHCSKTLNDGRRKDNIKRHLKTCAQKAGKVRMA